jgi:hypothetical protein
VAINSDRISNFDPRSLCSFESDFSDQSRIRANRNS